MQLTSDHLRELGALREQEFGRRLLGFLHMYYPESLDVPAAELRSQIEAQIARARVHGLASEYELGVYVHCAWLLGVDFDQDFPAATAILTDATLPPDEKARRLEGWSSALFAALERDDTP